jgi:hypothetical protein
MAVSPSCVTAIKHREGQQHAGRDQDWNNSNSRCLDKEPNRLGQVNFVQRNPVNSPVMR